MRRSRPRRNRKPKTATRRTRRVRKTIARAAGAPRISSRNVADLHPLLAQRWLRASATFAARHPELPRVFLTQTYRSPQDQAADYARGRSAPGKVVTNAKPGQSLHNYYPALAFDVAFKRGNVLSWDVALFAAFAAIAKRFGLAWGGDWKTFRDNPHFEPPNYGWRQAQQGVEPAFPSIT